MTKKSNTIDTNTTKTATLNFEFFEGLRSESASTPEVTVRRNGLMVLTRAAIDMLDDGATHIRFCFDKKTHSVGLMAAEADEKGAYLLRSQKHGASKTADGRRFFAHLEMSFEKAETYPAEDFGSGIVGFRLPNGN